MRFCRRNWNHVLVCSSSESLITGLGIDNLVLLSGSPFTAFSPLCRYLAMGVRFLSSRHRLVQQAGFACAKARHPRHIILNRKGPTKIGPFSIAPSDQPRRPVLFMDPSVRLYRCVEYCRITYRIRIFPDFF